MGMVLPEPLGSGWTMGRWDRKRGDALRRVKRKASAESARLTQKNVLVVFSQGQVNLMESCNAAIYQTYQGR